MPAVHICRLSLAACATVGMCLVLFGVFVVPAIPHFQLDAVLTQQELVDPQLRQSTLALLQKANGATSLLWVGAGLMVAVCAAIGLAPSFRRVE